MTSNPNQIQPSTFLQFEPFPSEPQNHYKSVRGEVFTEVAPEESEGYDVDVQAAFSVAGAGTVGSIRVAAFATVNPVDGKVLYPEDVASIREAIADLEHMNKEWHAFYAAASAALGDLSARIPE